MSSISLLGAAGITSANGEPTAASTVLTVATVAASSLVDGERFTVDDGRDLRIFEFDKDGKSKDADANSSNTHGPLNVILIDAASGTADQMRDKIIAAINGACLDVVAASGGSASVTVTANMPGANGVRMKEGVAAAGFTITVTTAGSFSGVWLSRDRDEIAGLEIWTTGAVSAVSLTVKLWLWTRTSRRWQAITPAIAGAALAPESGNNVNKLLMLGAGVPIGDRIYLDVSGTFASATVFADLVSKMQRRTA